MSKLKFNLNGTFIKQKINTKIRINERERIPFKKAESICKTCERKECIKRLNFEKQIKVNTCIFKKENEIPNSEKEPLTFLISQYLKKKKG
ncbi:hypothetical protein LCGC14_0540070 [marine sediment metagenome]|uniref:Uncharacterized protein n=1 Tax=marine sediment metagenome TaxID=412755 RepID=A0A0F9RT34_9ZZZZ